MFVFVLDKNRKPLDPTHSARARKLLRTGRASVFRRYPFTIILHQREVSKFGLKCAYCGATQTRLEIDHVQARSRGGSNRVSNLAIACQACNQAKGNQDVRDFLSGKPDVLSQVLSQLKKPLTDTAAVNATRWALLERLKATGVPVETGTGGQTKFNRTRLGLSKAHWTDAVAVGSSTPEQVIVKVVKPMLIKATGYGHRRMCNINKFGFPQVNKKGEQATRKGAKVVRGFQTGDMVRAIVPSGKNAGTHVGRVTVRATGQFDISTATGKLQIINWKYCKPIHKQDGYTYA